MILRRLQGLLLQKQNKRETAYWLLKTEIQLEGDLESTPVELAGSLFCVSFTSEPKNIRRKRIFENLRKTTLKCHKSYISIVLDDINGKGGESNGNAKWQPLFMQKKSHVEYEKGR